MLRKSEGDGFSSTPQSRPRLHRKQTSRNKQKKKTRSFEKSKEYDNGEVNQYYL
jgi:hypothetical protein